MRVGRKPEIGDTMFHVCEHLYYVPEHAAPLREYCVCEATVVDFLKGGYTEVKLVGKNPRGFNPLTNMTEKKKPIGLPWKNTSRKCLITKSKKQNAQRASNKALRSISKLSRTLMSESPRLWR